MKKRFKKLTALFLTLSMTLWVSVGAYASEVSMDDISEMSISEDVIPEDNEAGDTSDSTAENGVTAAMKISVKIKEKAAALSSLRADVDYVDGEGVILTETEEEAEKIAAEYGGQLKRYVEGIATIEFGRNTIDALNETADKMIATKVVEPNFRRYIDGVKPDYESTQDQSINVLSAEDSENSQDVLVTKDNGIEMSINASDTPNDPWYDEDSTCYQWYHDKIKTLNAHKSASGNGIRVAVLDTGINTSGTDFKTDTEVHYVSSMPSGVDRQGHGSNCAGIIGAEKNNNFHGFGVANGATIDSIKCLDDEGNGTDADIMEAMKIAAKNKANVISMSLGGPGSNDSFEKVCEEIAEEGITIIAAAGNESTDVISYPAGYDDVISVASAEKDDTLSDFSNYGDWVDIVACGGRYIYSEAPYGSTREYTGMAGTSQATPQVAAVAALLYEINPTFTKTNSIDTPNAIRDILLSTTDEKEYTYTDSSGNVHSVVGLVQADAAVEKAKNYTGGGSVGYTMVDPGGWYGKRLSGRICQGGSLKLAIGDSSGNVKAAKSMAKSAVWSSSNAALVSVKKGRVKCNKNAPAGTEVTVTATLGTEKLTYSFTITYKTKTFGVCYTKIKIRGHRYKYSYKFKSNWTGKGSLGGIYNLANPYSLTQGRARLMFNINKKTGSYYYYPAATTYRYDVTIPKSQLKKMTVEYGKNGKPIRIKINTPGKYTIKYKVLDGSNKTFKLGIKV